MTAAQQPEPITGLTDEAIDAAHEVIHQYDPLGEDVVREALEAALPHIRKQVLEEAADKLADVLQFRSDVSPLEEPVYKRAIDDLREIAGTANREETTTMMTAEEFAAKVEEGRRPEPITGLTDEAVLKQLAIAWMAIRFPDGPGEGQWEDTLKEAIDWLNAPWSVIANTWQGWVGERNAAKWELTQARVKLQHARNQALNEAADKLNPCLSPLDKRIDEILIEASCSKPDGHDGPHEDQLAAVTWAGEA